MRTFRILVPAAGMSALVLAVAIAASSANYTLDPTVTDQGGGETWSINYSQSSSIGGSVIGSSSSANFVLEADYADTVLDEDPGSGPIPAPALLVLLGAQTPGPTWETNGVWGLSMIQVKLSAGLNPVLVDSLTVTAAGTGNDAPTSSGGDIMHAHLYLDANSNGMLDTSELALVQDRDFTGDDGTVTFPSIGRTIPAGTSEHWIVVIDSLVSGTNLKTFQFSVAAATDVTASAAGNPVTVAGPPFSGYTKSFNPPAGTPGSLTISGSTSNNHGVAVEPGATVPVFQVLMAASSLEPVHITRISFATSGTGNEAVDVVAVWLYDDADSDGQVDPGEEVIGGPATFAFDNDPLTFNFSRTILANTTRTWMLVYSFSAPIVPEGLTFRANVQGPGSVTARGVNSNVAIAASIMPTAPLAGPVVTIIYPPAAKPVYFVGGCAAARGQVHPAAALGLLLIFAALVIVTRIAKIACTVRRRPACACWNRVKA